MLPIRITRRFFFAGEDRHDPWLEIRGHHHFGILTANGFGGSHVHTAVHGDAAAESSHAIREVGVDIGLLQRLGLGDATRVVVLDDHRRGPVCEVPQDIERIVCIGEVGLARVLAGLEQFDVRCQVLAGLDGLGLSEYEVAVDHAVQG